MIFPEDVLTLCSISEGTSFPQRLAVPLVWGGFTWCSSPGFPECPGFGQDRVNFHQETGGTTVGQGDPNCPNRAGYSISCAVMLGSDWGGPARRELSCGSGACGGRWELLSAFWCFVLFILLICIIVVTVPLFAVLLNCPYPDPPVSACFFPFFSAPQRGERRPHGAICCRPQLNYNTEENPPTLSVHVSPNLGVSPASVTSVLWWNRKFIQSMKEHMCSLEVFPPLTKRKSDTNLSYVLQQVCVFCNTH